MKIPVVIEIEETILNSFNELLTLFNVEMQENCTIEGLVNSTFLEFVRSLSNIKKDKVSKVIICDFCEKEFPNRYATIINVVYPNLNEAFIKAGIAKQDSFCSAQCHFLKTLTTLIKTIQVFGPKNKILSHEWIPVLNNLGEALSKGNEKET